MEGVFPAAPAGSPSELDLAFRTLPPSGPRTLLLVDMVGHRGVARRSPEPRHLSSRVGYGRAVCAFAPLPASAPKNKVSLLSLLA